MYPYIFLCGGQTYYQVILFVGPKQMIYQNVNINTLEREYFAGRVQS